MPLLFDDPNTPSAAPQAGPHPPKKKKKQYTDDPVATFRTDAPLVPSQATGDEGFYAKLAAAERFTMGDVPTSVTYSAALAATDDHEAARATAALMRITEVPRPQPTTGPGGVPVIIDPLTGGPISSKRLRQVRRLSRYAMAAQAALLIEEMGYAPRWQARRALIARREGGQPKPIDAERLRQAFEALSVLPGKDDARSTMAWGISLVVDDIDISSFAVNLARIRRWVGPTDYLNESGMVGMAKFWTKRHPQDFISRADIVRLINPEMWEMTAPLRAAAEGRYIEAADGFRNVDEATMREVLAMQKELERGAKYLPGAYEVSQRLVADLQDGPGGMDRVFSLGFQWVYQGFEKVMAGVWPGLGASGQVLSSIRTGQDIDYSELWAEARDTWNWTPGEGGGATFGDTLAEHMGAERGTLYHGFVSFGSEVLIGWWLDPFVIGGQVRRMMATQRLVSVGASDLKGLGVVGRTMRGAFTARNLGEVVEHYGTTRMRDLGWGPWSQLTGRFGEGVVKLGAPGMAKRYAKVLGVSEEQALSMPFKEFLVRLITHDPDTAISAFRGYAGLSSGLNDKVAYYIYNRFHDAWKGREIAFRQGFLDEGWDIFKTGMGLRSPTAASMAFDTFVRSEAPDIARGAIDESIRGVVKKWSKRAETMFTTGKRGTARVLRRRAEVALRRDLSTRLQAAGLSPSRTGRITERVLTWSVDDWKEAFKAVDEAVEPLTTSVTTGEVTAAAYRRGAVTWRDGLYNIAGAQRTIPTIGPLQVVRDMRLGFWESPFWKAKAIEHLGVERVSRMFSERAYRPWLNVEEYGGGMVLQNALQHLGFDDEYIRGAMARFHEYQLLPFGQKESLFYQQMEQVVRDYYANILGLPEGPAQSLVRYAMPRLRYAGQVGQEMYGLARVTRHIPTEAGEEALLRTAEMPLTSPPLGTMFLNTLMLPDPRTINQSVRRAFGSVDAIEDLAQRMFPDVQVAEGGKYVEALSEQQWKQLLASPDRGHIFDGVFKNWDTWTEIAPAWYGPTTWRRVRVAYGQEFDNLVRVLDQLRSMWVGLTLFRVGWPMKVLPDENMRAIITLHSLVDRSAAIPFIGKGLEPVLGRKATVLRQLPKERVTAERAVRPEYIENSTVKEMVYHGDGRALTELANEPGGPGPWGTGYMFTPNVEAANRAAARAGEGSNVTRAYINMEHPFIRSRKVNPTALRNMRQRFRQALLDRADSDGQVWTVVGNKGMYADVNEVARAMYELVDDAIRGKMTNGEFYDRMARLLGNDKDRLNALLRQPVLEGVGEPLTYEAFRAAEATVDVPVQWLVDNVTGANALRTRETIARAKYPTDASFERLKASIGKGWDRDRPLTIYVNREGKVELIDGTHRLLAARELGMEAVPVRIQGWMDWENTYKWYVENIPIRAQRAGYDGIIGTIGRSDDVGYLVFRPGQIHPPSVGPRTVLRERPPQSVVIDLPYPAKEAREPATAQGIAGRKLYRSVGQQMNANARTARWGQETIISRAQGRVYWEFIEKVLNQRIYQSPVGRKVLRYLARDMAEEGAPILSRETLLTELMSEPEFRALSRGVGPHVALDNALSYVDYHINGSRPLAAHMLYARGADISSIRKYWQSNRNAWPVMRTRALDEAGWALSARPGHGIIDKFFGTFMRAPSDYLNRNPLYQVLYRNEMDRLLGVAKASGREFTDVEIQALKEGSHHLNTTAKEYALRKELDVMYSFMNRSRFAEASRFVFPFFAPFEEQWRVWGRMMWENPYIIPRAKKVWDTAVQTGAVRKNEDGEWVVPAPVLSGAILLSTYFAPIGWLPAAAAAAGPIISKVTGKNIDWVYPLSSLNLFFASPFRFNVGDQELFVPLPGFGPVAEDMFQAFAETWPNSWPGKVALMDYAFAYGPGPRILPSSVRSFLRIFFPDDNQMSRMARDMLDDYVLQGNRLSGLDENELRKLQSTIEGQAQDWNMLLGFIGWMSPTPPTVTWEADDIRDEYYELREELGPEKAVKAIRKKYGEDRPDLPFLLTSATMMQRGLEGGGIAPPSSELFARILDDPKYMAAFQRHPEFGYFLVPQEFRDKDFPFDFNLYARHLAEGTLDYREPFIFEEGQLIGGSVREYLRNEGWNQYFAALESFNAKVDRFEERNDVILTEDDDAYKELYEQHMQPVIDQLNEDFLPWAVEHDKTRTQDTFTPRNLEQLRAISTKPIWRDTGFGKALQAYFEFRDPLYKWMVRNNVSDITDSRFAKQLGKSKEYKDGIKALKEQYGDDFTIPFQMWMDRDLHYVTHTRRDRLEAQVAPRDIKFHATWQERWSDAQDRAYAEYIDDVDRKKAYAKLRRLSLRAAEYSEQHSKTNDPFDPRVNPQMRWWEGLSESEKAETALRRATTPYVFLSAFDREVVLGVETNPENEYTWSRIEERKLQVYRNIDRDPEHERKYWEEYNTWLDAFLGDHPEFRSEVDRNTTWGWALWKVMGTYPGTKTWTQGMEGKCWKALRYYTRQVRGLFEDDGFIDDVEMAKVRNVYDEFIEDLFSFSKDFKDHYFLLQDIGGDPLEEVFVPQYWWIAV